MALSRHLKLFRPPRASEDGYDVSIVDGVHLEHHHWHGGGRNGRQRQWGVSRQNDGSGLLTST